MTGKPRPPDLARTMLFGRILAVLYMNEPGWATTTIARELDELYSGNRSQPARRHPMGPRPTKPFLAAMAALEQDGLVQADRRGRGTSVIWHLTPKGRELCQKLQQIEIPL